MHSKALFFNLFPLFILCLYQCNADEVPAILWNIKGNALVVKLVPALERDDATFSENVEKVLNSQEANILVLSVNKLSAEDFLPMDKPSLPYSSNSTIHNLQDFLETRPYIYMSSVKDPLNRLHKVHCGVQEIVVDENIDKNVLQSISQAFLQSCVVILHVSDFGVFNVKDLKQDDVQRAFLPIFSETSKSVVGIFTSEKSSWNGLDLEHHGSRKILQIEEEADPNPNFINNTCVFLYIENATVQYKNNSAQLILPPDYKEGSICGNETVTLQLTFKTSNDVFNQVVVTFNFKNVMGSWVTDTTISLSGTKVPLPEGELPVTSDFIEAPMKFSFNCGNLKLITKNDTDVVVTFKGFQVQPFPDKDAFSDSFDCVTFFTIPIWMGVFVALLFIIIINVGIYALFSVHTMDRFDDPKGKTISVALGD